MEVKSIKDRKNGKLHNFLVGSSFFMGIGIVLSAVISFLEPAKSIDYYFGGLVGVLDGIFGVVLIIVGAFCVYKDKKKVLQP